MRLKYLAVTLIICIPIVLISCTTQRVTIEQLPTLTIKDYQKDKVYDGAFREYVWLAKEGSAYILFLKYPTNKDLGLIVDGPVKHEFLHRGPGYDILMFIPDENAYINIRVKSFRGTAWYKLSSVEKPLAFMDHISPDEIGKFDVHLKQGDLCFVMLQSAADCVCEDFFVEVFTPNGNLIGRSDDPGCIDTFAFPTKRSGRHEILVNTTGCGGEYIFFVANSSRKY